MSNLREQDINYSQQLKYPLMTDEEDQLGISHNTMDFDSNNYNSNFKERKSNFHKDSNLQLGPNNIVSNYTERAQNNFNKTTGNIYDDNYHH